MKTRETERSLFEDFIPEGGTTDLFCKIDALKDFLDENDPEYLQGLGLQMLGPAAHRGVIKDRDGKTREVIMLGSNSYLGLTTHPKVVAASKAACDRYGYGMGAVSLYTGTTDLHRQLEKLIAEFLGTEDAIVFPCGYSSNVGILSALCGPGDVTINDAFNHSSLFDGCRLSGADVKIFLHRNVNHLEKILKRLPDSQKGRLIVTDGVFSMDGDVAPLEAIVDLAERYGARVMVDDAHAIGVIGPTGRGTAEQCGCAGRADIIAGTLSKAPGAMGGYCAGSAALIRYLRYYARTYFFSTSLPTPTVAGLIEVFKLMRDDAAGRDALWENIRYMLRGLKRLGFDTGDTASGIVPIIVGDETKLARFHNALRHRGVFTNIVTYPAVRRKSCRLRLNIMNSHTQDELNTALAILGEVAKACDIL